MKNAFLVMAAAVIVIGLTASQGLAHPAYKKALTEKLGAKTLSCEVCHVKGEKKTVRNPLGKEFHKALHDKSHTELYNNAKKEGSDARKAAEAQMIKEFLAVLDAVKAKESPDGVTYGELVETKKLEGVKYE